MSKERLPRVPKLCQRRDGRLYATDPHLHKPIYFKTPADYEEWRAAFLRRVPGETPAVRPLSSSRLTVADLGLAYLEHAQQWYRKDGTVTPEIGVIRMMLVRLNEVAGSKAINALRVTDIEAFLERCIDDDLSRRTINSLLRKLKTMAQWAVRKELMSGEVLGRILAVKGLQKGRTRAREKPRVKAVAVMIVEKTLPHLSCVYRAIVQIELLSGMRPGEVIRLSREQLDQSREPWEYLPARYKTQHLHDDDEDRRRRVFLGPRCRELLLPFLEAVDNPAALLFRRRGGKPVTLCSYNYAVSKACQRAGVPHWHPSQLRHAAGTFIRERYGAEAAQNVLGHENLKTTEIYAEKDHNQARKVMEELG